LQDSGCAIIDACITAAKRKDLDGQIFRGERSFRSAVGEMWEGVNISLAQALQIIDDQVEIDAHFNEFRMMLESRNIPLVVVSSGLLPCITHILARNSIDLSRATIKANSVDIVDDSKWVVQWVDDSVHGHDKAASFRQCVNWDCGSDRCQTIFIGDGVSDIHIATACDVRFAKDGLKLAEYLAARGIDFIPFRTFGDILHHPLFTQ
jgi:HAD superfamily phosphoserine phosphatase-like hydrolase